MMSSKSAYHPRPRSAGSRSSSFLDLSPLPEDVDINLGDVPSVSTSFDSAAADQQQEQQPQPQPQTIQPQDQQQQRQQKDEHLNNLEMERNRRQQLMRPVTAPQMSTSMRAQSPHLRSAKYLASQWRSRATQWSASSSMRKFKDTSSLPSSPPPPLSEHDSDSDSCGKSTTSLDESIQSHVSDAHSVLEPWKNRPANGDYSNNNGYDNQSFKTVKTSNKYTNRGADDDDNDDSDHAEFSPEDISKSFGFALPQQQTSREDFADYKSLPGDTSTSLKAHANTHSNKGIHRRQEGLIPPRETTTTPTPWSSSLENNNTNSTKAQTPGSDTSPRSVATENSIGSSVSQAPSQTLSQSQELQRSTRSVGKQKDKLQQLNSMRLKKKGMTVATATPSPSPATHTTSNNSSTTKKNGNITSQNPIPKRTPKTNSDQISPQKRPETSTPASTPTPTSTCKISNAPTSPRPATEPTRWAQYEVVFTFSLLTSPEKAPPLGAYLPDDEVTSFKDTLNYRSKLLHSIMLKFASTLQKIKSLSNEKGKYMMCPRDCTPTTRFVQRDATFVSPPERKTMRSLVRVSVPVFVPRGNKKARSDASSIVKKAFARAISTGKFNGFS